MDFYIVSKPPRLHDTCGPTRNTWEELVSQILNPFQDVSTYSSLVAPFLHTALVAVRTRWPLTSWKPDRAPLAIEDSETVWATVSNLSQFLLPYSELAGTDLLSSANAIVQINSIPTEIPAPNAARSVGVHIHPLTAPILPQAVGQVLIQALFTAYIDFGPTPLAVSNSFHHSVSSRLPNFNVEFEMSAKGNQTGDFVLTNSRVVETLSLLGFDYSNQQNVSSLVEYEFDVVIDVWMQPEVVIASGSVKNIPSEPVTSITPKV